MEITSLHFFSFVFGVLVIYHLLPYHAQNYWLLIASYVFYISWSWKLALLLLVVTIFQFELAKRLRSDGQGRSMLLWTGIGANILLFVSFKASNFYLFRMAIFLEQMGVQPGLGGLQIVIPLGLSYYVLQNISYLVDVYRGQMTASRNLVEFALYLAYFPKMVAGPIERARTFLPTLARPRWVENEALSRSLVLILIGLGRKLLIADLLFAHLPLGELTGTPDVFSKLELIGWMSVYAFALYNDFAGYTSIVRGFSGLFGIELSLNFNTPYFSKSFTEFWTRWHITLSQWLRDYIFFPISRVVARRFTNRNSWQNIVIPAMITMLVSGFWHQPNWQMLLWGVLHGLYLVGERVVTLRQPLAPGVNKPYWMGWVSMGIVFFLVVLAWVPFMMRVSSAIDVWNQLLVGPIFGFRDYKLFYSLSILAVALGLDYAQYRKADEIFFLRLNPALQSAILATVLALLLIVTSAGEGQPFIYQGF
jgi:alginate O-acetyltransferase complex protein AlgI